MERIRISGPSITRKEIEYVTDAVSNAWYGNANMYNDRFEDAFSEYVGVKYALALPSCTSAIHLSLLALGVGPGDEVILPDITWIGCPAPIIYVGATPVFSDIDPLTWCMSAESLQECVTSRTKVIMPTDLYGNMPDIESINKVAKKHGIPIVEDAAEAIGSEYMGAKAGSLGATGVFSFHGSKTMVTGEGGMLVTDIPELYERACILSNHGRQPGDRAFVNSEVGYKYKMSSMQAALGLAQLERIDELTERKREIFNLYQKELAGFEGITLNTETTGTKNTYWMVTAVLDENLGLRKERVIELMEKRNVDCRPFFHPLSSLEAYRHLRQAREARKRNRVSNSISKYGVNLPCGLLITEEEVGYVCKALKEICSVAPTID